MGKPTIHQPNKGLIPAYRHIQDVQCFICLQGRGNYTLIYMQDKPSPLLVSKTLKYFEEQLPDFIRLNKSFIINPFFVKETIKKGPKLLFIELSTGLVLTVSRRRIDKAILHLGQ